MDSSKRSAASADDAASSTSARTGGRDAVRAEIPPRAEFAQRVQSATRADDAPIVDAFERLGSSSTSSSSSDLETSEPRSPRARAVAQAALLGAQAASMNVVPGEQGVMRNPLAAPTELDLRRKRKRRALGAGLTLITVLDGPRAGDEFESSLRDFALQQTIFLLKSELRVGQRIEIDGPGAPRDPLAASADPREAAKPVVAEVVRSRLLSNGRWEIVAERVKASAPPKISESQRRHERRRQRLAQQGVILNTTMRPIVPKDEPPAK